MSIPKIHYETEGGIEQLIICGEGTPKENLRLILHSGSHHHSII